VTDPGVFKAVVAIAPVTDLQALKDDAKGWSNHDLVTRMIGEGPLVAAGSPARHAEKIKVPVLLFHGAMDRNVAMSQAQKMNQALEAAHVAHELITWDHLDHYLEDSNARAQMLRKSEAFLRQSFAAQ
jgi:dipeptidyl aminopeptidase/acylaminoacyl peptidase